MEEGKKRQQIIVGLALIGVGLVLLALKHVYGLVQWASFFLLSGAFFAAYFYRREFGFLILGCILLGLAIGSLESDSLGQFGEPMLLGLGTGFIAIFVIALIYQRQSHWWPLIPGTVLLLVGSPRAGWIFDFVFSNWPLILVFVGLMILMGALTGDRSSKDSESPSDD